MLYAVGVKRKYESERRSLKDDEEKRQSRLKRSKYSRRKQRVNKKMLQEILDSTGRWKSETSLEVSDMVLQNY